MKLSPDGRLIFQSEKTGNVYMGQSFTETGLSGAAVAPNLRDMLEYVEKLAKDAKKRKA